MLTDQSSLPFDGKSHSGVIHGEQLGKKSEMKKILLCLCDGNITYDMIKKVNIRSEYLMQ
jgi:hypothetical protein